MDGHSPHSVHGGGSWGNCGKVSSDFGPSINSASNMTRCPTVQLGTRTEGAQLMGDPGGTETRTRGLRRHSHTGPRRWLPAVVSGFHMILVSGDIPHALLADSSDHSFLWQPRRFRLQAALSGASFPHATFLLLLRLHRTHTQINAPRRAFMPYHHIHLYFINIYTSRHISKHRPAQTLTDRRAVSLTGK